MKCIFKLRYLFFLIMLSYVEVYAQQATPTSQELPRTKLESFQKQTGTVVIKGYSQIGEIRGMGTVSVDCMEFTDISTGKRQMGIVIDVTESGRFENSDRSFIDYEEVESLLNGIDYIAKIKSDSTKLSNFEAIYKTKGDFNIITFSSSGKIDAAVKSGYIRPATAYLSLEQLNELRTILFEAKQKLDSLK